MSYTYAERKNRADAAPHTERAPAQPSPDALRLGTAAPTREQLGRRVDLPDAIREKMETAFGADLSAVKLYESEAVADAGANAITQGSSIAFAPGMLDFSSYGGQALLGHEISHVVSQARGEVTGSGFLNDHALEARADREGAMAAAGRQIAVPTAALSAASAAPAAGPMQAKKPPEHAVDTGKFNFDSAAYRGDADLAAFRTQLNAYNAGSGAVEDQIRLMESASAYIERYSTGEVAQNKDQTAMMEDVLYQLTMKGGTQAAADSNVKRLKGLVKGQKMSVTETDQVVKDRTQAGKKTLDNIKDLYTGKKTSKAMKMIAADVMSRAGKVHTMNATGGASNATRDEISDSPQTRGYTLNGRVGTVNKKDREAEKMRENDSLGTTLHEFTHVANGEIFNNSDILFSFQPGADADQTRREMTSRRSNMTELRRLAREETGRQPNLKQGEKSLADYADDRRKYGSSWRCMDTYLPNFYNKLSKVFMKNEGQTQSEYSNPTNLSNYSAQQLPGRIEALNRIQQGQDDPPAVTGILQNEKVREALTGEYEKLQHAQEIFSEPYEPLKTAATAEKLSRGIERAELRNEQEKKNELQAQLARLREENGGAIPPSETITETDTSGSDTMVEYDSVINQMLAQYENAGGSRDSQYYRKLKSAAIAAHVRRRAAALRNGPGHTV